MSTGDETTGEVLSCGCALRTDEARGLLFFTPCCERHREAALRVRQPGSALIVRQVRS